MLPEWKPATCGMGGGRPLRPPHWVGLVGLNEDPKFTYDGVVHSLVIPAIAQGALQRVSDSQPKDTG